MCQYWFPILDSILLVTPTSHTHAHTHSHSHTSTHTHTCIHTHTHTCMLIFTHTLTCIHTHTHTYSHINAHTLTYTHTLVLTPMPTSALAGDRPQDPWTHGMCLQEVYSTNRNTEPVHTRGYCDLSLCRMGAGRRACGRPRCWHLFQAPGQGAPPSQLFPWDPCTETKPEPGPEPPSARATCPYRYCQWGWAHGSSGRSTTECPSLRNWAGQHGR